MCTTRRPKPQPSSQSNKPPVYMTNPFLDDPANRAISLGRNALRIDLGGLTGGNQPPAPVNPPGIGLPPPVDPGLGIGGRPGAGGGGRFRPGLPGHPEYPQYPGYPRLQLL